MIEVFQNDDDGMWYFYGKDYEVVGPFETKEDADKANGRHYEE